MEIIWTAIAAVIIFIIIIVASASSKQKTATIWEERNEQRRKNIKLFDKECEEKELKSDLVIATKAYHYTDSLQELFNLRIDYKNKMIGLCSFESQPYKSFFLKFDEIVSFEILDGTFNSSSESISVGNAIGGINGAVGIGNTETIVKKTIENLRLKIETNNPYALGVIVCLFNYQLDTSSDIYRMLMNSVEDIKTALTKIIQLNSNKK